MHAFSELISIAVRTSLIAFSENENSINIALQESASTPLVKGLQTISWQRAILATGIFSLFEAHLQNQLGCKNGFKECSEILKNENQTKLNSKFQNFKLAINVLKHGKGSSYNQLIANIDSIPFDILQKDEECFYEGDVSEITTLIKIDDAFVLDCLDIICKISYYLDNNDL
jgi:hypothetical protein